MKLYTLMLGLVALAAAAFAGMTATGIASAAPAGAATNLKATSLSCASGMASYKLTWTASGKGAQRVDLSATNNGFANKFSSANLGVNASRIDMTSLKVGTTYYVRIVTFAGGKALSSDILAFKAACQTAPVFSVPTKLQATQIGKSTLRFQWLPGAGNKHFCLDTASTAADLMAFKGSFRNHHCGTSIPSADVSNLKCGSVVFWRVFAWGNGQSGHSSVAVAAAPICSIGAPFNLYAQQVAKSSVLVSWTPGSGNRQYCVEIAKNQYDLDSRAGSYRSHGCWTAETSLVVTDLECGKTYLWRVAARNEQTSARSGVASFQTTGCSSSVNAPIETVKVAKSANRYYAEILVALPDACHSPGSYQVQRSGNTFHVTVLNNVKGGQCAFLYDTYELRIFLSDNLVQGQTYKVVVNGGKSDTFVAN